MKKDDPIKSQHEADEVLEHIIQITMSTLKIPRLDAEFRVGALRQSGLLNQGGPDDQTSQMMIDLFMTNPQWDTPEYQEQIKAKIKTNSHEH